MSNIRSIGMTLESHFFESVDFIYVKYLKGLDQGISHCAFMKW